MSDIEETLNTEQQPSLPDNAVSVYALGPWCAECAVCEDESGNVSEKQARAWANDHICKGLQPCGCPARLLDKAGWNDREQIYYSAHYAGCSEGDNE